MDTFSIEQLKSVQVGLASPDDIRGWSHGEVTRAETINYRSQKPEMGGLFCEKIFGPSKDYECHCGKYKKIRFQGITCEKCGVEVISKEFRRERMGHIELVSPCSHIWYLKGIPSRMGLVLDMPPKQLEEIIYFNAHICLSEGESRVLKYKQFLDEKTARIVMVQAIEDFRAEIEPGSADDLKASELIDKMQNPNETFDFASNAAFISKYTGAEFGEGAAAIKRLLKEVDLDEQYKSIIEEIRQANTSEKRAKLAKRLDAVEAFRNSKQKPEWMVLDVIPIIPPDLRPMLPLDGGRFAASDLNDLYRRVISRNNRMKKLIDMNAPYVILMNEKRMLQEAVDALFDNGRRAKPVTGTSGRALKSLSSGLKGKQGRFRQNLLGKRVDYSGRSVIAVGPDLKMYQCGLPREMAIQLLRPFIAAILIRDGYVTAHKQADKFIDRYESVVFDIVESIISDHPVLLNRAPTLHRLGIQAFQPKLVDGRAIRLHPLVCTGFNADFDGDQMAVHVPLSKEAQAEALNLMLASNNILGPKDGKPIVVPSQDMVLGNYYLTIEEGIDDFLERAAKARRLKDDEEAEKFERFARSEGKVFASIEEIRDAYEIGSVSLHNRIALRACSLHKNFGEDLHECSLPESVKGKYLITTVGKIIFNDIFPDDFVYINGDKPNASKEAIESWFVSPSELAKATKGKGSKTFKEEGSDFSITIEEEDVLRRYLADLPLRSPVKKKDLGTIIDMIFHKYGTAKTSAVLDKIKDQGFEYSTHSSVTIAISDMNTIKGKDEKVALGQKKVDRIAALYRRGLLSDEERHRTVCRVWEGVSNSVREDVAKVLEKDKKNPLVIMSDSGARGSLDNFRQLIGMRGLMSNPKNETIELPITTCFREGMKVAEFFIATHGARKGGADTALKTADSGYLTRKLVDVSQDVIVREENCHCDHGFKVRVIRDTGREKDIVPLYDRLVGRFAMHDVVNPQTGEVLVAGDTMIDEDAAKNIVDCGITEVEIRSILTCQTHDGVCRHCYGRNMATGKLVELGEAVGIMAAQSIGEPGTQLTMRVFHTGGVAGSDITQGLPRVQELVEARAPKGEAKIAKFEGVVEKIEDTGNGLRQVTVVSTSKATAEASEPEVEVYDIPYGARLRVKEGDVVEAGGKITEGAVNPKELLLVADTEKVQVYIIKEIQKVYQAQGIGISDKHIEVILRQMLRKVMIIDGGDTNLFPGQHVDRDVFTEANKKALLEGKRPALASPRILGITKAALATNSFLSAASFQETTRVLTDAAIKAKTDPLHGLKENVITGKLIPAGTGLLSREEEAELLKDFTVAGRMKEVKDSYIEAHDRPFEN